MAQRSPTLEGFHAVFRRPALVFAEITWRWSFAAAASLLLVFAVLEYLDTLTVTSGEQLFLRSRQPFLILQAIAQIFSGSAPRLILAALILAPALAVFWVVAGAFGRAATLQTLMDYFDLQQANNNWKLRSLLALNFLRVSLGFACLLSFLSAAIIAVITCPKNPNPGVIFLVSAPLACIVVLLWSTLNWYLLVAALFVIRDGQDTFGAIAASVVFARSYPGPLFWSSTIFALLHFLTFIAASIAALVPMAFATVLPPGIIALVVTLITFIYFGLVDLLHIGRLAVYVSILKDPHVPSASISPRQGSQLSAISSQPEGHMRDDDDILSDIPGLLPPPEPAT